ncbi:hypothetical protein CCMA1212_007768 [Trichoderma ghanense]|uniref:Uncharacterized protein n=1 Tax=Trichoderma ghanense TaxID=65468 RepID=A0ABY2GXB0_9HYPO
MTTCILTGHGSCPRWLLTGPVLALEGCVSWKRTPNQGAHSQFGPAPSAEAATDPRDPSLVALPLYFSFSPPLRLAIPRPRLAAQNTKPASIASLFRAGLPLATLSLRFLLCSPYTRRFLCFRRCRFDAGVNFLSSNLALLP